MFVFLTTTNQNLSTVRASDWMEGGKAAHRILNVQINFYKYFVSYLESSPIVKAVSPPLNGEGDTHMMTTQFVSPLIVLDRRLQRKDGKAHCCILVLVF